MVRKQPFRGLFGVCTAMALLASGCVEHSVVGSEVRGVDAAPTPTVVRDTTNTDTTNTDTTNTDTTNTDTTNTDTTNTDTTNTDTTNTDTTNTDTTNTTAPDVALSAQTVRLSEPTSLPPGVAESFDWPGVGGGHPCAGESEAAVRPTLAAPLDVIGVCLPSFDPDAATTITLTTPSGRVFRIVSPSHVGLALTDSILGTAYVDRFIPLHAETGRYIVRASQGDQQIDLDFMVQQPVDPQITLISQSSNLYGETPGNRLSVGLTGFAPETVATIDIYYSEVAIGKAPFLTSFDGPVTDSAGRAQFDLDTHPDDPPGAYCFVARQSTASTNECWTALNMSNEVYQPEYFNCRPEAAAYTIANVSVDDGGLRLREAPGLDAEIVGLVPWNDAHVSAIEESCVDLDDGTSWTRVNTRSGYGWVSRDFLRPKCDGGQLPTSFSLRVISRPPSSAGDGIDVLRRPADPSTASGGLAWGTRGVVTAGGCELASDGSVWWEIEYDGTLAWVLANDLTL